MQYKNFLITFVKENLNGTAISDLGQLGIKWYKEDRSRLIKKSTGIIKIKIQWWQMIRNHSISVLEHKNEISSFTQKT